MNPQKGRKGEIKMAINPMALLKMKERMSMFQQEHPKIRPFFQTLKEKALVPGTVFEMTATTPDGKSYTANFRLTENDIETIRSLMK